MSSQSTPYCRCTVDVLSPVGDPKKRSKRAWRDELLKADIQRVWADNRHVYGARKVWKQLNRDAIGVVRWTAEHLMRVLGLQGLHCGKRCKTTLSD